MLQYVPFAPHRDFVAIAPTRLLAVALLAHSAAAQVPSVDVEVLPDPVYVEAGKARQHLNFDFRLHNSGGQPAQLIKIQLSVFDREDEVQKVLFVDRGGTAPGINTFLSGPVPANGSVYIFNPYHDWDTDVELARLEYTFTFANSLGAQTARATVRPRVYEQHATLRLPMEGRILVNDGHDYLSHHRRVDLDLPALASSNLKTNSNRYAYDFVVIDAQGLEYPPGTTALEDCYGWDAPVVAPAAGRVIHAVGDFPDNTLSASGVVQRSSRVVIQDVSTLAGNVVALDHGNGEYSMLGHLRSGSVTVEVGDMVESGQLLGTVGLSGATSHVHLHYQLQSGASFGSSEGLPSLFSNYERHLGSRSLSIERGQIDSGDIVEALPGKAVEDGPQR